MVELRVLAVAYLGAAAASAIALASVAGLALVAVSLVSLIVGYLRKAPISTAVAGLALYYPLAVVLGHVIPMEWNYVASATLLILLSEKLSFEYRLSTSMQVPLGVDEESRMLAARLSSAHSVKLLWFASAAVAVSAASILASVFSPYIPVLITACVLLVLALWVYTHR